MSIDRIKQVFTSIKPVFTGLAAVAMGGMFVNAIIANKNAVKTCFALAGGEDPKTGDYLEYYGSPLPVVEDARFGLEVQGGPIFRDVEDKKFNTWETARLKDAPFISDYCNSHITTTTERALTADKVRKALLKRDERNAQIQEVSK